MKYRLEIKFVFILLYMSCALLLIKGEEIVLAVKKDSHLIYVAEFSGGGFYGNVEKKHAIRFRKTTVPKESMPNPASLEDKSQPTTQHIDYENINYIRLQVVNKKDASLLNNDAKQWYLSHEKKPGNSVEENLWKLHDKAIDSSETRTADPSITDIIFMELPYMEENEPPYQKLIPYAPGVTFNLETGPFLTLSLSLHTQVYTTGEIFKSSVIILDNRVHKLNQYPDLLQSNFLQKFEYVPVAGSSN